MSDTNQPGAPENPEPAQQPVPPAPAAEQPQATPQPAETAQPVEPAQQQAAEAVQPQPVAPEQPVDQNATVPDPAQQWAAPVPPAAPEGAAQQQWAPPAPPVQPAMPGAPVGEIPQQWVPQPGGPGVPNGPQGPGTPPPAKRGLPKWALWLIIGGSAAIVAIIALIVVLVVVLNAGGPKGTASDYLESLSSGKVATANKIARIDGDKRLVVLASDAYAKSKRGTEYELTSISQRDDQALASTTYKIDGSTVRGTFELRKDDKGWYVSRGLTSQLPRVYGSNGAEGYRLPGYDGLITSDLRLEAYPGVYTAEAPNKYFEFSEPFTFEIGSDLTSPATQPKLVPSQAMADEIDAQLKAHIDECLKSVTDQSSVRECGISGYPSKVYNVQKASVSVKSYPKVGLQQYSVELKEKGAAKVTFTGKQIGGGEGSETIDADFSRLIFRPVFEDGKLTITYY